MRRRFYVTFACMIAGLPLTNAAISAEGDTRLLQNLRMNVHPVQDDDEGYRQAKAICKCAINKARSKWDESRLAAFDDALNKHTKAFVAAMPREGITVEFLFNGKLPRMSDDLQSEFRAFGAFIKVCEEEVGGRGVEF